MSDDLEKAASGDEDHARRSTNSWWEVAAEIGLSFFELIGYFLLGVIRLIAGAFALILESCG